MDGRSGMIAGTRYLGVRVVTRGITVPQGLYPGAYMAVTGISRCMEIDGGTIVHRLLARKIEDIAVIQPSAFVFPIGPAKQQPDGMMVRVQGIVSWAWDGFFYCPSFDRSSGIRLNSAAAVTEGESVEVLGTVTTISGERQINAATVRVMWWKGQLGARPDVTPAGRPTAPR